MRTTVWPASWNSRSFRRTTVWPTWMSGAVGSMPSLTRSGRPSASACASFAASAPSGRQSTAFRARYAAAAWAAELVTAGLGAASEPGSCMRTNANLSPFARPDAVRREPPGPCWSHARASAPAGRASAATVCSPHMSRSERDIPPSDPPSEDPASGATVAPPGGREGGRTLLRAVPDAEPRTPADRTARSSNGTGSPATRDRRRNGAPPLPPAPAGDGNGAPPHRKVRVRKLRVLAILLGLGVLAVVSTVFGMMMAVASDLPQLEDPPIRNSVLVDRDGRRLGLLTGSERRIFVRAADIAPVMKQAIIAIEDRRFYTNDGVDFRGIARALYQDIIQKRVVQGGSTITQQFVKNALAAQDDRTVFQKLREAALAFQITRKWSKERILRDYLNTIYFGNGAYGIESAAKTYFGRQHPGC